MSAALYEKIGQQLVELEDRKRCYSNLLALLAQVVQGYIDPARIMINLTEQQWLCAAEGERPATPATLNGLPICVVAPEPPAAEGEDHGRDQLINSLEGRIESLEEQLDRCRVAMINLGAEPPE
jgi:hypothetical protein